MILVDTSVWIDHLRVGQSAIRRLLEGDQIRSHPFVIGELACGHLKRRAEVLDYLTRLPSVEPASHVEVMHLLEVRRLAGRGITWVDMHLLASTVIAGGSLWTLDKSLAAAARDLGVGFAGQPASSRG